MQLQLQRIGQPAVQRHAFDVRAKGGDAFADRFLGNGKEILLLPHRRSLNNLLGGITAAAGHGDIHHPAEYRNAVKTHAAQNRCEQQDKHRAPAASLLLFTGLLGSHGLKPPLGDLILPLR